MDWFLLYGMIGFGLLIVGWLGYSTITTKIIREQEKEIEDLQRIISKQNNQLRVYKAVPERFKLKGEEE